MYKDMKKKFISFLIFCIISTLLYACSGTTSQNDVKPQQSSTQSDMESNNQILQFLNEQQKISKML